MISSALLSRLSIAEVRRLAERNRTALALLDQAVVSGSNFVTSLAVGRLLGKELFGTFFIVFSTFALVQCIADQLVHTPYLVRSPKLTKGRLFEYTSNCLLLNLAITLATVCCLLAAAGVNFAGGDTLLGSGFLLWAAFIPFLLLRDFVHNYFHNRLQQFEALLLSCVVAAIQIPGVLLLYVTDTLTINRALIVIGVASVVAAAIWLPMVLANFRQPRRVALTLRRNWKIGRWALGSYLIGNSAPTLLPWLLAALTSRAETGLLAGCMSLVGVAQIFIRGVGRYMAPCMARQYADAGLVGLRADTLRFTLLGAAVVTPLAIGLGWFGPWLIELGYGYTGSESAVVILAVYCWIQMIDVVAGNALLALGQTQLNFLADAFRCVGLVIPAYPLIAGQGVSGAAWCLVLGVAAGLVLRILLVVKHVFRADQAAPQQGSLVVAQPE